MIIIKRQLFFPLGYEQVTNSEQALTWYYYSFTLHFYFLFLLFSMEPSHHSLITTTQNIISFNIYIYIMILLFSYLFAVHKKGNMLVIIMHPLSLFVIFSLHLYVGHATACLSWGTFMRETARYKDNKLLSLVCENNSC